MLKVKSKRYIILLCLAVSLQAVAELTHPCDSFSMAYHDQLPEHYCDCEYSPNVFAFPIDTVMTEPAWFTATMNDLKQGLSAYWFSDDSVVMDVYAFCFSTVPTFSMTVAPNRMYEMDMEKINKKLDELGNNAAVLTALTPHIHVYTVHGEQGHVYCYPYDQGPHSTCENTLEMYPGMTYVCSEPKNVYRLPYSKISSKGHAFIQWKHKPKKANQASQPANLWLTLGACEGDTVGSVTLSDSLHVYQPDSAVLALARTTQQDIWVHVQHAAGLTGRVRYINNPVYSDPLAAYTGSTCVGKTLTVNERAYSADTAFVDTLWVESNILQTQSVKLHFTIRTTYDTVRVSETELRRGYVHSTGIVLHAYGDTIFDIVKPNTCTARYQVTVLNPAGIETVAQEGKARKQIINGQLVILIDDKRYNVLGQPIDNLY